MFFCEHSLQHSKVPSLPGLLKKCGGVCAGIAAYKQKGSAAQTTYKGEERRKFWKLFYQDFLWKHTPFKMKTTNLNSETKLSDLIGLTDGIEADFY